MPDSSRVDALADVLLRLAELIRHDELLRQRVERLISVAAVADRVERVIEDVAAPAVAPAAPSESAVAMQVPAAPVAAETPQQMPAVSDRMDTRAAIAKLDIGSAAPRETADYSSFTQRAALGVNGAATVNDDELPIIALRSRLKAESCRWQNERRQLRNQGAESDSEIVGRDQDMIARGKKLPECFLWMCNRSAPSPATALPWEIAAGAFEAMARAVEVVVKVRQLSLSHNADQADLKESLFLLAEAQSALRVAVETVGYDNRDHDQTRAHLWLKRITKEEGVYLSRFMRLEDPGDPTRWEDLIERVEQLERRMSAEQSRRSERDKLENKLKFHLAKLSERPESEQASHWATVVDCVTKLVGEFGVPPSNQGLRNQLLPMIDMLPDELATTPEFDRVLESIDQFLADREEPEATVLPETYPKVVQEVRRLLSGQAVVLIGGVRRPQSERKLEAALGASRLEWISTREHQSIAPFETAIARPDVAVVLLAIRWSSHSYEGVKTFCDTHDKLFVRLPAGYGIEQVAHQILQQAGKRLESRRQSPTA